MTITMAGQDRGEFLDVPTLSLEFCVWTKKICNAFLELSGTTL